MSLGSLIIGSNRRPSATWCLSQQIIMYPLVKAALFSKVYPFLSTTWEGTTAQHRGRKITPRVLSHSGCLTICQTTIKPKVCGCARSFKKHTKSFAIQVERMTKKAKVLLRSEQFHKDLFLQVIRISIPDLEKRYIDLYLFFYLLQ